jgi:hypothetical protein
VCTLHEFASLTRLRDFSARTLAPDVLLVAVLSRAAVIRFHVSRTTDGWLIGFIKFSFKTSNAPSGETMNGVVGRP